MEARKEKDLMISFEFMVSWVALYLEFPITCYKRCRHLPPPPNCIDSGFHTLSLKGTCLTHKGCHKNNKRQFVHITAQLSSQQKIRCTETRRKGGHCLVIL